jgi:CRISPR-associated exonuclease Cas4
MLSALQHWSYCPRQCGLIHLEQAFDENVHTMRGNAAHERVDEPGYETFEGVRAERALPVWSDRLGLIGKCDVVEFHPDGRIYPNTNMARSVKNLTTTFSLQRRRCVWKR